MNIWVDDVRPAPIGFLWAKSVNHAKNMIETQELMFEFSGRKPIYKIELIDIDHDAGDYVCYGGDYIRLLDWLEESGRNYPIHIHSMNSVGVQNMRAIIQKNGWTEIR